MKNKSKNKNKNEGRPIIPPPQTETNYSFLTVKGVDYENLCQNVLL